MKVLKYHIRKGWQNKCWEITFLQWLHVKFSFFSSCHNVVLKLLLGLGTKNTGKHAFTSRSVSLEICTDPRQISSRFTFRNVETQTRARVAGLAASSPVTSDLNTVQPSLFTPTQSQTYSAFSSTIQNLLSDSLGALMETWWTSDSLIIEL